jgi:hypothetical protein
MRCKCYNIQKNKLVYHAFDGHRFIVFGQQLLVVVVVMQMIFVKHFLGCLDDCRSRLVDFDSPTTCSQLIFPCSKPKEEVKVKIWKNFNPISKHLHPTKKWQWAGWSLMMWKVWLVASHSRTASSSRGNTGLSESRDRRVSTMSSSKGNCNWMFKSRL